MLWPYAFRWLSLCLPKAALMIMPGDTLRHQPA
jgi:hypothetical protein